MRFGAYANAVDKEREADDVGEPHCPWPRK